MNAFTNICSAIGSALKRKITQVKVAVEQHNEPFVVRPLAMRHSPLIFCGGSPIPLRFANQRQQRKLRRQTHY